jgi:hypothetical protein
MSITQIQMLEGGSLQSIRRSNKVEAETSSNPGGVALYSNETNIAADMICERAAKLHNISLSKTRLGDFKEGKE